MLKSTQWQDLTCKVHDLKIKFIDITSSDDCRKRAFCEDDECAKPQHAITSKQAGQLISDILFDYKSTNLYINEIKDAGKKLIQHFEINLDNTRKLMDNLEKIYNINTENTKFFEGEVGGIDDWSTKFSLLLMKEKNNLKFHQDLLNIHSYLQTFNNDFESNQKRINTNIQLLNNKQKEIQSKISNQDSVKEQQFEKILCPQHNEPLLYFSSNKMCQTRANCNKCSFDRSKIKFLSEILENHEKNYNNIKMQVLSGEDFFISILKKSIRQVTSILGITLKNFFENFDQLDDFWCETNRELSKDDNKFNIKNSEQLEKFAQWHYDLFEDYYSNSETEVNFNYQLILENYFLEKIEKQNQFINNLSSNFMKQIQLLLPQFQQSYNFMQRTCSSKNLQNQVQKALLSDLKFSEEVKKTFFDEQNLYFILQRSQEVEIFQRYEKQYYSLKVKHKLGFQINQICFQKQANWFVAEVQMQKEQTFALQFFEIQKQQDLRIRFEYQCNVEKTLQLEVDEKNGNCLAFHQNNIVIWKKRKQWEQMKQIPVNCFKLAQFNSTFDHLAVICNNSFQIISLDKNEFLEKGGNKYEFKLQGIEDWESINQITFFKMLVPQKDCHFLLFNNVNNVVLVKFDLQTKSKTILKYFPFLDQSIDLSFSPNLLTVIDKDREIFSLYKVDYNQTNQQFTITMVTQIVSRQKILNSALSFNANFLVIKQGEATQYALKIYQAQRLPQLQRILSSQLNIMISTN